MPKYKVTGGQDGTSGVTIDKKWYAPGETIEAVATKVRWLVEQNYLAAIGKAPAKVAAAPAPEETE